MEEFKIVKFNKNPNHIEENEVEEVEEAVEDDYRPPKKRILIIPIILILIIISYLVWRIVGSYSDFDLENSWTRTDATESTYELFCNNILKYSSDGVFYTSYSGSLIWNYTYNMISPQIDKSDNNIVIYDKKGTEIDVFSQTGYLSTINTNIPIVEARVGKAGTVAVMLQEDGVTYLQMYSAKGKLLAGGEIHPENGGYPVSIALSSDAKRLAVSVINVSSGKVKTDLIFYDFSSDGKTKQDNIVGKYTYIDMIIPKVEFFSGNRAVAFGENEIIIFNDNENVTVAKEIYVEEEIKNVFHNKKYFGYVIEGVSPEGEIENKLFVYNLYGFNSLNRTIDEDYKKIELLDNNEILLTEGGHVCLYNLQGFKKFNYEFDENVYGIVPGLTSQRYYVLKQTSTDDIHIK